MTEAEEIEAKNDIRAAVKKYTRFKLRDFIDELSVILSNAGRTAQEIEHNDEDLVMDVLEQKYGASSPQIIKDVKAMLDLCDTKHTENLKVRDGALRELCNRFLTDAQPEAGPAPTPEPPAQSEPGVIP